MTYSSAYAPLGERVARVGAFISRGGPGEGVSRNITQSYQPCSRGLTLALLVPGRRAPAGADIAGKRGPWRSGRRGRRSILDQTG